MMMRMLKYVVAFLIFTNKLASIFVWVIKPTAVPFVFNSSPRPINCHINIMPGHMDTKI